MQLLAEFSCFSDIPIAMAYVAKGPKSEKRPREDVSRGRRVPIYSAFQMMA